MLKVKNKVNIVKDLSSELFKHKEIVFALIHRSFIDQVKFNDIDVAIYIKEKRDSVLKYELNFRRV